MRRFVLFMVLVAVSGASAQARRTVSVTEIGSGRPLVNAEVLNRGNGEAVLTDDSGEVVLPNRWAGVVALRVRQVGFRFADVTLALSDSSRTFSIQLRRVAYILPTAGVTLQTSCTLNPTPEAALLAATALEQLQMSAERYNTFKKLYPFRAHIERRTSSLTTQRVVTQRAITHRPVIKEGVDTETTSSSEWGEKYDAKRIVDDRGLGFSVQLLFLAHLADPAFWARHCFEVDGVANLAGRPMIRLRFAPLAKVSDPDWEGWAYMDSTTSDLRRLEFHLSHIPEGTRPQRLEGYTTFMSPAANIVLPESTAAIWWRKMPPPDSKQPDVVQILRLVRLEYRGSVP